MPLRENATSRKSAIVPRISNRRRPKCAGSLNHRLLIQGNKMSNLTFFIVLAGLLLFPGLAPGAETEPIAALCARPGLQALREAKGEMTVRDTADALGMQESTLRQLLKGLAKERRTCGG